MTWYILLSIIFWTKSNSLFKKSNSLFLKSHSLSFKKPTLSSKDPTLSSKKSNSLFKKSNSLFKKPNSLCLSLHKIQMSGLPRTGLDSCPDGWRITADRPGFTFYTTYGQPPMGSQTLTLSLNSTGHGEPVSSVGFSADLGVRLKDHETAPLTDGLLSHLLPKASGRLPLRFPARPKDPFPPPDRDLQGPGFAFSSERAVQFWAKFFWQQMEKNKHHHVVQRHFLSPGLQRAITGLPHRRNLLFFSSFLL